MPEGATVIDAAGGTVLAGFWNCHVHVVDTGSNPADTLAVRRRIEAGELAGPSIITAGIPLAPVKGTPIYVREAGFQLPEPASPDQARAIVGEMAGQGVDAIEIFAASFMGRGQKPPVMAADVIAAVVDEAHRRKLLVFAHPTNLPGLNAAVDGGVDVVLHTSPDGGPWPEGTADHGAGRPLRRHRSHRTPRARPGRRSRHRQRRPGCRSDRALARAAHDAPRCHPVAGRSGLYGSSGATARSGRTYSA